MTGTPDDPKWQAFRDRLARFVRKHVRHAHDADDVLQEIFRRLHSGVDQLAAPDRLEAWVFQVARHAILDHLRRAGRKQPEALPDELADESPSPSVSRQIAGWLRELLAELGGPDREALELTDLEGVPQSELAARLGLSPTGARSRVQRARRRLRELLLRCCHVELDRRGNAVGWTPRGQGCPACKDG